MGPRRIAKGRVSRLVVACVTVVFAVAAAAGCRNGGRPVERSPLIPRVTPYEIRYPLGLQPESAVIPADNPMTVEKVRLGRRLFFETRLSVDNSTSCASCHIPEKGFADPAQFSTGVGGRKGLRQAPTVINRLFSGAQFWDGRATSLEEQALGPMLNPVEMGMPNMALVIVRLQQDASYVKAFEDAFPPSGSISEESISHALACFERTILSGNSPFDRFIAGDTSAMNASAKRGWQVFKDEDRGNCVTCHVSFNFTDENYSNLGIGMAARTPDLGRYEVTKYEGHQGAFKTPTLREIARTAPYLHDGSEATLEGVLSLYEKGGHPNKWLSPKMRPLRLTPRDKRDLVEFMNALSGEVTWFGRDDSR